MRFSRILRHLPGYLVPFCPSVCWSMPIAQFNSTFEEFWPYSVLQSKSDPVAQLFTMCWALQLLCSQAHCVTWDFCSVTHAPESHLLADTPSALPVVQPTQHSPHPPKRDQQWGSHPSNDHGPIQNTSCYRQRLTKALQGPSDSQCCHVSWYGECKLSWLWRVFKCLEPGLVREVRWKRCVPSSQTDF